MQLLKISEYARNCEQQSPRFTPEIYIFETTTEVDTFAATRLIEQVQAKPASILTLPTGNTPVGMYKQVVNAYNQRLTDLHAVTIFNLDEYYPISQEHPNSYAAIMKRHLINHLLVAAWHIPNGEAKDPELEAERYKQLLEQHQPIDLAILGIGPGTTCHIGFNEKGSSIGSNVRYVPLHPETKEANAKLFDNPRDIPDGTITQGIADILQAKQILVIAKGTSKAWGINRALKGPVSSDAPASFLRLHPNVTFVLDKNAGQYIQ